MESSIWILSSSLFVCAAEIFPTDILLASCDVITMSFVMVSMEASDTSIVDDVIFHSTVSLT